MSNISIRLHFSRNNSDKEETMILNANDYFDEDDSEFEVDSVPRFNHAIEYIPDNKNVTKVTVEITDDLCRRKKKIETFYWANQDIEVIFLSEYKDDSLDYSEVIHQVRLPKLPNQDNDFYSLGRFLVDKDNNDVKCLYYGLIEDKKTTEEEYRLV